MGAVVQLLSCVQLFATLWTAAHQVSLPFTISQSLLKLMSIELVMPTNHLVLCHLLLFLPLVFPSIRVSYIGEHINFQIWLCFLTYLKLQFSSVIQSCPTL